MENSRTTGIIISVSEASVDGTMKVAIPPQMPFNITSAGKKSTQIVTFQQTKLKGTEVELKIHVLDEKYKEIFVTDFLKINL